MPPVPKVPEPAVADEAPPPGKARPTKKKKLLIIVIALLVVLAIAAAGGLWFLKKQRDALAEDSGDAPVEAVAEQHDEHPPTFMALDNMVVNLADTGGERFAQVGITFEVADSKAEEKIKAYLPSIRNSILLVLSQRTATELLQREGKEKLAQDILVEASRPFGGVAKPEAATGKGGKKKAHASAEPAGPVRRVLFSSFIIQ
jgi:flagellar FliL protein